MGNPLKALASSVWRHAPWPARVFVWRMTDADYRRTHDAARRRREAIRAAQLAAGRRLLATHGPRVLTGPFSGMKYVPLAYGTVPTHKLLGTYEKELWPVIEAICTRGYTRIVDVGAADGYYVCGLASRLTNARVTAFEMNRGMHTTLARLTELNQVRSRVEILGLCTVELLRKSVESPGTLVVADIEGAEHELLDPDVTEGLRRCDLLVEVHDHIVPGISATLRSRFASTHDVVDIASVPRTRADLPPDVEVDDALVQACMDEQRDPASHWFWLPRRSGSE